ALETRDEPESRALWWQLREEPLVWKADLGFKLYQVAVAPSGRFAAVAATEAGNVQLIDLVTRERRVLRPRPPPKTRGVAVSPDGAWVAAGSADPIDSMKGSIQLWNVASGESRTLGAGLPSIINVRFSDDGARLVASGGPAGFLAVFAVADGTRIAQL